MEWPAFSNPDFVEAELNWPVDIHSMFSKVTHLDSGQQRLSLGAISPRHFRNGKKSIGFLQENPGNIWQ